MSLGHLIGSPSHKIHRFRPGPQPRDVSSRGVGLGPVLALRHPPGAVLQVSAGGLEGGDAGLFLRRGPVSWGCQTMTCQMLPEALSQKQDSEWSHQDAHKSTGLQASFP